MRTSFIFITILLLKASTCVWSQENRTENKTDTLRRITLAIDSALMFKNQAQYVQASDQGILALQLAERINDSLRIADALNSLGNIYKKQNQDSMALDYLLRAYSMRKKLNSHPLLIAHSVSNVALLYEKMGDYNQALILHQEAYDRKSILEKHSIQSTNATGLGLCYWKLGDFDRALHYLEEAIMINADDIEYEINRRNIKTFNILGEVYLSKHDYPKAQSYLEQSLDLALSFGFPQYVYINYECMSRFYSQLNQPTKALRYYKRSISLRDSIVNTKNLKMMTELNLRYNYEKTQAQNEKLKSQSLIQENELVKELSLNRLLFIGFLSTLIIIALVIALLWRNRTQKKRVIQKNIIIQNALEEKEELLQEIHHRVKNNLQVISSLFALQVKHLKDDQALTVIKDCMNLVSSMSLVHEQLYIDKSKNGIIVPQYITDLMISIRKSFHRNNLKFELDIDSLTLNIETMIYLGMLINELTTNIFKYAFPDNTPGNIHISLKRIAPDRLLMEVKDDGIGFDSKSVLSSENKSIGYKLINSFLRKLKGTIEISSDHGTKVIIEITKFSEVS